MKTTKQKFVFALLIAAAHFATKGKATELAIIPSGGQVILTWPQGSAHDFYLEVTTNLLSPMSWRPAADPFLVGSDWVVTNDTANASCFYRLQTWDILFDGTSTSAFRGYQQPNFPNTNIWIVNTNGELEAVTNGVSVDIITTNQYGDFELRWEWKTIAGGNSGVNYRSTEEYSRAEWSGPEYQLLDDPSFSVVPQNTCGSVWNLIAPTNKTLLPAGQWNECRLLVQGNHVEHWLNAMKVVSYELDSPAFAAAVNANPNFNVYPNFGKARTGHIGFRHENTQVWFRKSKVRQIPPQ